MEQREDQSSEDKTEEATDERRNQFREEGNIANPREIVAASVLIIFTAFFYFNSSNLVKNFELSLQHSWLGFSPKHLDSENLIKIIFYVASPLIPNFIFLSLMCVIFPLLIGLLLTRFNFTLKKLNFNIGKLNPISGVGKIISLTSLMELFKTLLKFIILTIIIYLVIKNVIKSSPGFYFLNQFDFLGKIGLSIFQLLFSMSIASIFVGFAEYFINLWKIEKELKMSKQELKEDLKKHEGDPLVKSQRKRMSKEFIFRKSLKDVPKASFIVTNPEHFAIAILYVKGMNAPIVLAKGQDLMAFKIREIAKKNDIVIVENKPLARTLYKTVKIGQEVPASLYQAIIEVMKYIYKIRGKNYFDRFSTQKG